MRVLGKKQNRMYQRCENCRTVQLSPPPCFSELVDYYEAMPKNYQTSLEQSASNEWKFRYLINRYLSNIFGTLEMKSSLIVDVGAFTGDFLNCLARDGFEELVAFEINPSVLPVLRGKNLKVIETEFLTSSDLLEGSVDAIFLLDVIEHVTDPLGYIAKAHKLLKDGGYLVLTTPDSSSIFAKTLDLRWPLYDGMEHINVFSSLFFGNILRNSGFSNVEIRRLFKKTSLRYLLDIVGSWSRIIGADAVSRNFGRIPVIFYAGEFLAVARKAKSG